MKIIYRKFPKTPSLPVTRFGFLRRGDESRLPEGGNLTGASKKPNKTFRLFVFENMRSSANDRRSRPYRMPVSQTRRAERSVVDFGLPRTTI